ncbi:MAG: hypothetical protein JWQ43_1096 [Glaciihabitans sp.]|nr:hypothetical protein [Glaciihabitans sp.]
MDTSLRIIHKSLITAGAAAILVGLSACSPPDPADTAQPTSTVSSPGAAASGTPTPTQTGTPAPSPSEQAARTAAVKEWVDSVLPVENTGDIFGSFASYSDGDGDHPNALNITMTDPGDYSVYVVCRGDGSVSFTATSGDLEVMKIDADCDEQVQGVDVTLPAAGINFVVIPTGTVEYGFTMTNRLAS